MKTVPQVDTLALAPVGVPHADILVTDVQGHRTCALQVKSRSGVSADGGWHMGAKHERLDAAGLFYVFVDFGASLAAAPSCFILPAARVAEVIRRSHQMWLEQPGRGGRARRDGTLRRFLPDYSRVGLDIGCGADWLESWRDAWRLLSPASMPHAPETEATAASSAPSAQQGRAAL